MRKRIFEIIEAGESGDLLSKIYDIFMILAIVTSIIPLMFKTTNQIFIQVDKVTAVIFIVDYLLRIITADYKLKIGKASFVKYPFSFMAIVDLLSILPSLVAMSSSLKLFKVFRLFRTFRVLRSFKIFRIFKVFRYSKNIEIIINVFKKQKDSLIIVGILALGYIFITALIMFTIEPHTFDSFFDALYWATVSLTTVGYGDLYAISTVGKIITMISALFGIAIVALPAGIVTAGYMEEIQEMKKKE